ncbi:hypothetical protein [Caulobacter sp. 17J80-11]|uniref:hypothetical protein n=1 Tax=Caulobacter sp. 17J80-11 TaxID=2763502 RepID=UPI001653691D|nr:hypothetical protein [Caulobacter sp. 17J80-11]MBC6981922.1 hypothetical protein [Caulobacter sp. 17J80-11]
MANPAPAKRQRQEDWFGTALNEARRYAPAVLSLMTPGAQAVAVAKLLADREASRRTTPAPRAKRPVAVGNRVQPTTPVAPRVDRLIGELNRNPLVREVASYATMQAARPYGAARSMWDSATGLVEAAPLINLAAHPLETLVGPNRDEALRQALGLAIATAELKEQLGAYVDSRRADPGRIGDDIKKGVHDWYVGIDPAATPRADTALGEIVRVAPMGRKQGELALDVGSLLYGGAELKGLSEVAKMGRMTRAERLAKYAAEGLEPKFAENWALPDVGQGHHAFIRQSDLLPKFLGGGPFPREILDHSLNVLKPVGFDKGQQNVLHFKVDEDFFGGRLPKWVGQRGWSGKRMGLTKYGELGRNWHGRPIAARELGLGLVELGLLGDFGDMLTDEEGE